MDNLKHIAISVTEGRTVRDLFYNGLLDMLTGAGWTVTVFTEAARVPEFVAEWKSARIDLSVLYPSHSSSRQKRAFQIRRWVARWNRGALLEKYLRQEERFCFPPRPEYLDELKRRRPALVMGTHSHLTNEAELLSAAHALGIPTLGMVRSWDNVHKGIHSRPRWITVWNEVNRQELIQLEGYRPERVVITGPPQFDPYFQPGTTWSREFFCQRFRLDPSRPIILFATLGNFFPANDETCWMRVLMALLEGGQLDGRPQVICRLHPWSRLEQFQGFGRHPDVRLSYAERYWPALQWYMTRDEVVEVANMLRHADVVITPGSTMVLEAAIFDRPTLVPIFHPYQPERASNYFRTWVLGKHYARIEREDLVPLVRVEKDFRQSINRCLREPQWYRDKRARLVQDYVGFSDGCSTRRLAGLAMRLGGDAAGASQVISPKVELAEACLSG